MNGERRGRCVAHHFNAVCGDGGGVCRGPRAYAVPIVAKHWDRPPNIFGETSEYVPCGAIYWHRLANMCG